MSAAPLGASLAHPRRRSLRCQMQVWPLSRRDGTLGIAIHTHFPHRAQPAFGRRRALEHRQQRARAASGGAATSAGCGRRRLGRKAARRGAAGRRHRARPLLPARSADSPVRPDSPLLITPVCAAAASSDVLATDVSACIWLLARSKLTPESAVAPPSRRFILYLQPLNGRLSRSSYTQFLLVGYASLCSAVSCTC